MALNLNLRLLCWFGVLSLSLFPPAALPYSLLYSHYQHGGSSSPPADSVRLVERQCGKCAQLVDGIPGSALREHSVREMPDWLHRVCLQSARQLNIGVDVCSHFLTFGPMIRTQLQADGGALVAGNVCSAARMCHDGTPTAVEKSTSLHHHPHHHQHVQLAHSPHPKHVQQTTFQAVYPHHSGFAHLSSLQPPLPPSASSRLTTFSKSIHVPVSTTTALSRNSPRTVAAYQTGPSPPAPPVAFTRHIVMPAQRDAIVKPAELEMGSMSRSSFAVHQQTVRPSPVHVQTAAVPVSSPYLVSPPSISYYPSLAAVQKVRTATACCELCVC